MRYLTILLSLVMLCWSAPVPAQSPADAPSGTPQGNADNGKKLFLAHGCWSCHGYAAQGGQLNPNPTGPRLIGRLLPFSAFSKYVRRPTGNMPPYTEKVLPEDQLADVYAWLKSAPAPPPASSVPILKD